MTGTRKLLYQATDREEGIELSSFLKDIEKRAFRIAEIETRNRDDALEIVQEAMLRLVQKYSHRPSDQWKPLFYRILQNALKDFHRKSARQKSIFSWQRRDADEQVDLIEQAESVDPEADPVRHVEGKFTHQQLMMSLTQLSLRQRQVFLLRIWEGFDVEATAKIMRCSKGSVKTHLSRAMHALRATLGEFV